MANVGRVFEVAIPVSRTLFTLRYTTCISRCQQDHMLHYFVLPLKVLDEVSMAVFLMQQHRNIWAL
jgi:hypothetical protein